MKALRAGQVYINAYGAGGGIELPFGGFKNPATDARRVLTHCMNSRRRRPPCSSTGRMRKTGLLRRYAARNDGDLAIAASEAKQSSSC
jgi:hypothetical protein